jgi:hypothetical protein
MAKPSKSQNPEFLEKRRKAIVELAKRRRQLDLLRAAGISTDRKTKVSGPVTFAGSPPPQA